MEPRDVVESGLNLNTDRSNLDSVNEPQAVTPLDTWRREIENTISQKKALEQQELEIAMKKATKALEEWRQNMKDDVEKRWQSEYITNEPKKGDENAFDWGRVLNYLETHSNKVHGDKMILRMIELIKNKVMI
ncbi:Clathrin light chain [Babesia duncani]|uniref:Clathrin light chain n=1 Tax=Babesia duncani TaxID=323732 RepID=A0AAD9PK47_9APIC|nr:Clathrin light chain [Babesia duncani]